MLAPAIGWGPKSASLRAIAARLNLGIDTFLLIDDSPFERAEVADALPMVRVVSDTAIGGLLERPELDLPTTGLGAERRESYRTEFARQAVEAEFGDDREAFLRSCGMTLAIGIPDGTTLDRCHELVQRSNQLNMSGKRYERDALETLVATEGIASFTLSCNDRFGDYGLVGFVVIDERGDWPLVRDMVVSCRVAEKRVEATFFRWYCERAQSLGHAKVFARLALTTKNRPMARALESGGFSVFRPGDTQVLYAVDIAASLGTRGVADEPVRIAAAPPMPATVGRDDADGQSD
jgi:FkbH-like protein